MPKPKRISNAIFRRCAPKAAPSSRRCARTAKTPANGERHLRAADAYRADSFDELKKEVFGPVLHVVRYNRNELDELVEQINASTA
jgi:delta 1-pyrroline-5-carboxylate dehydrogenase